ncbi:MinD-like ATPase involved in chromosome partitioning or flagellar assembly [Granulicella aggregans]|uniref:MinD-like ATPase involved in chromosome partitioning or flagellar assembly n=1 Tax=Granulicella aggregans TaxID=474949 RepID=A0A7W8E3E0_9BACT|nr:MinD-like ATPase involved in chromosome partitioning or flagellar assembly [Granulicella aggregans]
MFDPDANMPRLNRSMVYLGACLIAGIRLAREKHVNVRVIPTSAAIDESVELAHEIYNRVFRRVRAKVLEK